MFPTFRVEIVQGAVAVLAALGLGDAGPHVLAVAAAAVVSSQQPGPEA